MSRKNIISAAAIVVLAIAGMYMLLSDGDARPSSQGAESGSENTQPPVTAVAPEKETSPAPAVAPTTHEISIEGAAFTTKTITIRKGDTVAWINRDGMAHTVTGDAGGPSSDTIQRFGVYSYTFSTAGTFPYHCELHPRMTARVIVVE